MDPFGGVKELAAQLLDTPLDPEIVVLRRPAPDAPRRAVRRAARGRADASGSCRAIEQMREPAGDRLRRTDQRGARPLLLAATPRAGLELLVETGLAEEFLPELPALQLEQDPVHRHKDVLRHTYAVVAKCEPTCTLRLAALLHDIGKPRTRQITADGRVVPSPRGGRCADGARAAPGAALPERRRSTTSRTLVELHLRFHGYGEGWSDSAVRRYVRDAGPLLDRAQPAHARRRHDAQPVATRRSSRRSRTIWRSGSRASRRRRTSDAMRPPLDGRQVMEHLGIEPGPAVGRGARAPDGGASRTRPDRRGRGLPAPRRVVRGARAGDYVLARH